MNLPWGDDNAERAAYNLDAGISGRENILRTIRRVAAAVLLFAGTWAQAQLQGDSIRTYASHPVAAIQDTETAAQRDARMAWWREARFGMFIHWGLYSIPAGTWDGKQIPGIGEWIMNNHSGGGLQGAGGAVQPDRLLGARYRRAGEVGRHEVHRHHGQAP
jgi:hypothetical protein